MLASGERRREWPEPIRHAKLLKNPRTAANYQKKSCVLPHFAGCISFWGHRVSPGAHPAPYGRRGGFR